MIRKKLDYIILLGWAKGRLGDNLEKTTLYNQHKLKDDEANTQEIVGSVMCVEVTGPRKDSLGCVC